MTNLLQAAQQMLWAVEKLKLQSDYWVTATNNLRQAIAQAEQNHSGEDTEMVATVKESLTVQDLAHVVTSDPLYQQGFVDGVEEGRNRAAEQQEPVAWLYDWEHEGEIVTGWVTQDFETTKFNNGHNVRPLYAAPVRTKDLTEKWIDPNDKSQQQYLPHIGEKVLFCRDGEVYYGHHTGGAFQKGHGVTKSLFPTWDCMWMHLPTAFIAADMEKNK